MLAKLVESVRFTAVLGVISLLLTAVASLGWASVKSLTTILLIINGNGQDAKIPIALIELVDSFLITMALFVFAFSFYELFIGDLKVPDWMVAHNLQELKSKLSGVIVLVIVVKFVERLVKWEDPSGTLFYGLAVAVVSAVLIALTYVGAAEKD